ncbi:MAG: NfeD family protein, partial [Anaerovoracaceae bacterium]
GITIGAAVLWLVAAAVLAIIEALTQGLTSIWFAGGAVAASIAAMAGGALPVQVVVFLAVSAIMLAAMRPIVRKRFNNRVEKTNVEALPGSEGIVEERVTHLEPGAVRADGKIWSAVCAEGETIEKDAVVVIKSIKGVTLMVEEKR